MTQRGRDDLPDLRQAQRERRVIEEILFEMGICGKSFAKACETTGMSQQAVRRYREKYPEFDARVKSFIEERIDIEEAIPCVEEPEERFFLTLQRWGDHAFAASIAGKDIGWFKSKLDPNSDEYDEEFLARYREYQLALSARLHDRAVRKALEDGDTSLLRHFITNGRSGGGDGGGDSFYVFDSSFADKFLEERFGASLSAIGPRLLPDSGVRPPKNVTGGVASSSEKAGDE